MSRRDGVRHEGLFYRQGAEVTFHMPGRFALQSKQIRSRCARLVLVPIFGLHTIPTRRRRAR
jgi:hypothetical protein